jgi:hypothetical protein
MYSNAHSIMIDNPTWTGITVNIDSNENIIIPAKGRTTVKITSWSHTIYLNGKTVWNFEKWYTGKAFLNPTGSIYIIEHLFYGDSKYQEQNIPNNTIDIFWEKIEWPFEKLDSIFITWNWKYNLNESYPENVKIKSRKKYKVLKKIYRLEDIIEADFEEENI